MTNWALYDYCDTCHAHAGKPCWDMRYARSTGRFESNTPHWGRPKLKKPTVHWASNQSPQAPIRPASLYEKQDNDAYTSQESGCNPTTS